MMFFQEILEENYKRQKLEALLYNVTVPLASHLDVLYFLEFSFISNVSQWRSICVFRVYIKVKLIEFFE